MADETKRRRGAPKGNQNARKRNFYSKKLTAEEQKDVRRASRVDGIDDEIAMARVKLQWLMDNDPTNLKMIWRGMNSLGRLLRTRNGLGKDDARSIEEAVEKLLGGVPLPPTVGRKGEIDE